MLSICYKRPIKQVCSAPIEQVHSAPILDVDSRLDVCSLIILFFIYDTPVSYTLAKYSDFVKYKIFQICQVCKVRVA
jgi:hypothetical protein